MRTPSELAIKQEMMRLRIEARERARRELRKKPVTPTVERAPRQSYETRQSYAQRNFLALINEEIETLGLEVPR